MKMREKSKIFIVATWGLTVAVVVVAFIAWGQNQRWHIVGVSSYRLFPLFGLLAFSIMWAHYIASTGRRLLKVTPSSLKTYFSVTGYVVVVLICLHPGLLVWQLWRDGFGLPPESYLHNFVAPSLRWAAMLGSVSLFVFLAYELGRWFRTKKWWIVLEYASDAAMVAIFFHALNLGDQLQAGWFRFVWIMYGITLAMALIAVYYMTSARLKDRGSKEENI